ncbi:Response regulator receiver domain-containing protein [Asanoa hainanensis]|uniref:Response regulator receiver domain-containing protein n=1 Tax=Asanoa hainanensis TaxID=560556 RepID=A0A239IS45_9ACTN|nr:SpoIIE family protein phosphatase [Asanoa hainanensis]SNS95234.1 Response regulator receiver domain-containing protein [Asanoa hainanensis]
MEHPESATALVVDDSDAKRYLLVRWLTRAGLTVVEADSGAAALERIEHGDIDLVVLDVRLGDMSGFEVAERIKSHPALAATPVIHVSAHAVDVADRAQGLTRGADAYLAEPIEPDELIATAHAVLRYYRARRQAETLAAGLTRLAETTVAVNSARTLTELLTAAALGAAEIFASGAVVAADTVTAGSSAGDRLVAAVPGPAGTPVIQEWPAAAVLVPVGALVRSDPRDQWPQLDWPGDEVAVGTARIRADRPPLHVAVPAAALRDQADVLRLLVQAVAAAVEAQRTYDEEHRIALTLQRSLLPQRIPAVPGYDLAVRYVPASAQTEVGGDFYELTMIGGQLLAAIGDVTGHSLYAATVMAELRHAVRAYAVEGHQPAALLALTDRLLRKLLPGELATICVLMLDPVTGRIRLANAGHPPPVLVVDGTATFVEHPAPLLGIDAPRPGDLDLVLPPGGTLVLYTDGLIERRTHDIDHGLAELATAAIEVNPDLDRYADHLLALATPPVGDDIAVVALHRR